MKNLALCSLIAAAAFVATGEVVNLPNTSTIAEIQAAIDDANPGDVITLADGTYAFDQQLTVNKGVTLTGSHRDRCILKGDSSVKLASALSIDNVDACVKNLTVSDVTSDTWFNNYAVGVRIYSGLLTQARVTGCKTSGGNRSGGVSLEGKDAKMTYCIIDHNEATGSNGVGGICFLNNKNGGTVANCLVWANTGVNAGGIGIINLAAWSPFKVVNCTIVGNTATTQGGGITISSANVSDNDGSIVNNIIAYNTAPNGTDLYFGSDQVRNHTGYNCLCPSLTGDDAYGVNPQTADPVFVNAEAGDFHLQSESPARNNGDKSKAASVLGYDLEGANDLYGTARVLENLVDIGCSEYEPQQGEDADKLTVSSLPQEYGATNPAGGRHGGYVAGTDYTLMAQASWTSDDGFMRAVCTNCTVTEVGGGVIKSESFSGEDETCSITYTHPACNDGVVAVWLWGTQNKVTVAAGDGGTVSCGEAWIDLGGDFTVTATPDDGYCIYRWVDVKTGTELGTDASLTIAVAEPRSIAVEFISLSTTIAYDPSVADYTPIIAAVVRNVEAGTVLSLEEGVYPLAAPLVVNKAITLQGAESGGTVLKATYKCNAQNSSALTVSGGATISRVAITGGLSDNVWQAYGVGVTISSGTLSECAVTNNVYAATGNECGVGVYAPVSGGATVTIAHCKICDNTSSASFNSTKGVGLYVAGSGTFRMDNCLVSGNASTSGNTGTANCSGGGLWISHSDAQIVNCTFTGNHHNNRGGGVFIDGGKPKFVNCIIAGNTAGNDADTCDYAPDISATSLPISTDITGNSFNNLVSVGMTTFGENGLAADPLFAEGGYQLQSESPARNAGDKDKAATALGHDLSGTDLYGSPRVLESQVDIGCAEFVPDDAVCSIVKSADSIYQGNSITLTGSSLGFGDADDIVYTWTITPEGGEEPIVTAGEKIELTPETVGTYKVEMTASSEKKMISVDAVSTTFLVKDPPMFFINGQGYDTWKEAYDAVPNGGTIKVGANARLESLTVNKSITFDLNGQTLQWVSGWMCYTYHIIDTGTPAGSGRFELAAGSGNNNNIGSATLDLSVLAADQFAASSRFWTNGGTTILFPNDMPFKACTATYANQVDGEKLVAQGVSYIYNAAKKKWKREIPLGLMIKIR